MPPSTVLPVLLLGLVTQFSLTKVIVRYDVNIGLIDTCTLGLIFWNVPFRKQSTLCNKHKSDYQSVRNHGGQDATVYIPASAELSELIKPHE